MTSCCTFAHALFGPTMTQSRDLRSHFVIRVHRACFFLVYFLANKREPTGKTFRTPLTIPIRTYHVKFIFPWNYFLREFVHYCQDLNECSTLTHNCPDDRICENTNGSFLCICPTGFAENGTLCKNIDECSSNQHNCTEKRSLLRHGGII